MKKFFQMFVLTLAVVVGGSFVGTGTASAEQIFCSHYDGDAFYLDLDSFSGTRSGLTYVDVYRGDCYKVEFCFQYWKGEWTYNVYKGVYKTNGFVPVSSDKLANDVLYLTLKYRGW